MPGADLQSKDRPFSDRPFRVRSFQPEDLAAVLNVLEATLPTEAVSPERFTRQVLLDHNFDPRGAAVALVEDRVVGFCLGIARRVPLENAAPDTDRAYITLIAVDPPYQRGGIGSALLSAGESYLTSLGRTVLLVSPYAPGYFVPGVDVEAGAPALAFFLQRGYAEMYRAVSMETSLWAWNVPLWVQDRVDTLHKSSVVIEAYRPELTLPLLDFVREEFPGDWVRVAREAMNRITYGESPDRLIVARDGTRILGFVHHENERFGPIGVGASHRGRGIGQVLMFEALRAMRRSGIRAAWFLWSDDRTARRLYDSASFRTVRRFAILRKEITAAAGDSH